MKSPPLRLFNVLCPSCGRQNDPPERCEQHTKNEQRVCAVSPLLSHRCGRYLRRGGARYGLDMVGSCPQRRQRSSCRGPLAPRDLEPQFSFLEGFDVRVSRITQPGHGEGEGDMMRRYRGMIGTPQNDCPQPQHTERRSDGRGNYQHLELSLVGKTKH